MNDMSNEPADLYELCDQVCDAIALSPANYYQEMWATPVDALDALTEAPTEACGTAFCRAGHMVAILDSMKGITRSPDEWPRQPISDRAHTILERAGVPGLYIGRLFSGDACSNASYNTPEYIQRGIEGMRKFMATHEHLLKAAKLSPDGELVETAKGPVGKEQA